MSACNCCNPFPINVVTLQARGKEGFDYKAGFEDDGTFYLQRTTTYTADVVPAPAGTYKVDAETAEMSPWDGSAIDFVETITRNDCGYEYNATGYSPEDFGSVLVTYQFANEYADNAFIDDVFECLGHFEMTEYVLGFGEWGDNSAPTATRIFYEVVDAVLYTESAIEVRISHRPTATGYLKAWLLKRVRLYNSETDSYGAPADSLLTEYEWTGEPADAEYSINDPENLVVGATIEVERGELNTSVQIVVAKWSLIPEYEPSDPIANEETYELERPSPDCESNGVPTLNEDCPFRE